MSESESLFVREMRAADDDFDNVGATVGEERAANVGVQFALMSRQDVAASTIHAGYVWIMPTASRVRWVGHEHTHDYDEVLMWMGNDPDDPHALGAELALSIEGEFHKITTTGSVYIPAGTKHCPLDFIRVDRPFAFSALSLSGGAYASSFDA